MVTCILMVSLYCCGPDTATATKVETVKEVDLARYQGRWYEIASYPQWYEKGLTNVSALYTIRDGYVEVLNSGTKDGEQKEKLGKARVVKGSGNAQLKVCFFWPFSGKYWIVDLDPDYAWVAVSNPDRSTLWILSRTPAMNETLYAFICERLVQKGFDIGQLVRMEQDIASN